MIQFKCAPALFIHNCVLTYHFLSHVVFSTSHFSAIFFFSSRSLSVFTRAGVILQKFSVTTATAVDPALRGQQTQVLAPSVVHTAQRELTLGEMGRSDKIMRTKPSRGLQHTHRQLDLSAWMWQCPCLRRMHNSMRLDLNGIQRYYHWLWAFTGSVWTGACECSVNRETVRVEWRWDDTAGQNARLKDRHRKGTEYKIMHGDMASVCAWCATI